MSLAQTIDLGVNVDHVATLRQARGTRYPDPVEAAFLAEGAGADLITVHLREDRRHIQQRDVEILLEVVQTRLNLEMAATDEMIAFAEKWRPRDCCIVPERREELTTEGGLDVAAHADKLSELCARLAACDVRVSLFIDPELRQIEAAAAVGAPAIELHTGTYANADRDLKLAREQLVRAAQNAAQAGLKVNAGHGLNYRNVTPIAAIPEIVELNIGHAIIARAAMVGMTAAVSSMKRLLLEARR